MNKIIIAAAGSGKTTRIVKESLNNPSQKILIVTYTLNNVREIKKKFYQNHGHIPAKITIYPWFTFLLRDFVRPYQNFVYSDKRIESIAFVNGQSTRWIPKSRIASYYLAKGKNIYTDKISEFGIVCNQASQGLVMNRLSELYHHIYIDEIQDMSGYDIELIELMLKSDIQVTLVGDHRQATFTTNNSLTNKNYRGIKIINKFLEWEKRKLCSIEHSQNSFRCNQNICNLADMLFPDFPKTTSKNTQTCGHDGLFFVHSNNVDEYIERHKPQILRYDKNTIYLSTGALNFGDSKGLTFDHVLILPHGPIKKLIETGDFQSISAGSSSKFYVAVTRAKYSVAFVYDRECNLGILKKWSSSKID